jgi:hypothetical protein
MLRFCSYLLCLPPDHAAFQADDEGSIPFTRSKHFKDLSGRPLGDTSDGLTAGADVLTVSTLELALFYDAKLDLAKKVES